MPTVLRRSGPDFEIHGRAISPKAMVHLCEGCSVEGAPFLFWDGKAMLSWCARDPETGEGYCRVNGRVAPAAPKPPLPAKPVEIDEPSLF